MHALCTHTHADPSDGIQGGSINLQDLTSGSALGSLPEGSSGDVIPPQMFTSGSGDTSSPDIINWEIHHTVMAGAALELLCQATGTPQPTVNWIRQGVQMGGEEEEEGVRICPNGSLVMLKVGMEHQGRYKCVAWNHDGLAFRTTEVTVVTGETTQ